MPEKAIAGYGESRLADGEPLPIESHPTIATTVFCTPDAAAWTAIVIAFGSRSPFMPEWVRSCS
jgi:hypothetical protein